MAKFKNKITIKKANIYKLTVMVSGEKSRYSIESIDGEKSFKPPDSSNGKKIYMLVNSDLFGSVVYVGQTIQSMDKRFNHGFYKQAYKWSRSASSYTLFVWDFSEISGVSSHDLDAIESELTFAARASQKCWPLQQTSIKFRWFRTSKVAGFAPYIVMEMMTELYDFLLKMNHGYQENIEKIENEKDRIIQLLDIMAI